MRNVRGHVWKHKRVYRIYRELELNLRIKPRKRLKRDKPEALEVPQAANEVWSIDFMADHRFVIATVNHALQRKSMHRDPKALFVCHMAHNDCFQLRESFR